MNNTVPHCAFWDKDENRWSVTGCNVNSANETHVICHCYHMTNFVILMTVSDAPANMDVSAFHFHYAQLDYV